MNLEFFKTYYDLAVSTYHVDPKIFVFLMVLSVPFYYYGWYGIVRAVFRFKKNKKNDGLKTSDFFSQKYFLKPLIINRLAWVMPYIYVIFWGRNLSIWFWIIFGGWIGLSGYLFKRKIVSEIKKGKQK